MLIFLIQFCSGKLAKILKLKDSACNDERLKLVNDMVVGVRTLKSYGWEQHYLKKITNVRKKQQTNLFFINALGTLGLNVFQNLAMVAVFLIFYYEWSQGEEIELAKSLSTLAIIFFLFVTVNQLSYIAIFQMSNFFAILRRVGGVLRLEDFDDTSAIEASSNQKAIQAQPQTNSQPNAET